MARKEKHLRLQLRGRNQITLPKELIGVNVSSFEATQDEEGRIILTPLVEIPANQAYVWTKRWQEGEREASADIKVGRTKRFDTVDDALKEMDKWVNNGEAQAGAHKKISKAAGKTAP